MDLNQNKSFEGEETPQKENYQNKETNETKAKQPPFDYRGLQEFAEKQSVKKTATIAGCAMLLISAVVYLMNVLSLNIYKVLNVDIEKVYEFLNEPAIKEVRQILFSVIGIALSSAIVYKIAGYRISSLISFKKPKKENLLIFFLIGISFCAFANVSVSIAGAFFENLGFDYNVNFGESPKGVFGFLLVLISTVITPSLVEEFTLRGLVLGSLRKFGDGFAIIVSSVIFGVMHSNFQQMPFAFLVGLVLGFITVKSGSIWVAVFIHAFNNLISVLMDYIPSTVPMYISNIFYAVYIVLVLALGIIAISFIRDKNEFYELKKAETLCKQKVLYTAFFTNVAIIIFIAYSVFNSFQYFV